MFFAPLRFTGRMFRSVTASVAVPLSIALCCLLATLHHLHCSTTVLGLNALPSNAGTALPTGTPTPAAGSTAPAVTHTVGRFHNFSAFGGDNNFVLPLLDTDLCFRSPFVSSEGSSKYGLFGFMTNSTVATAWVNNVMPINGSVFDPSMTTFSVSQQPATAREAPSCNTSCLYCIQETPGMPVMPWLWTTYMYYLRYALAMSIPVYAMFRTVASIPSERLWNWRDDPVLLGGTPAIWLGLLSYAWLYHGVGLWQAVLPDLPMWIDAFIGGFWRFAGVPLILFFARKLRLAALNHFATAVTAYSICVWLAGSCGSCSVLVL